MNGSEWEARDRVERKWVIRGKGMTKGEVVEGSEKNEMWEIVKNGFDFYIYNRFKMFVYILVCKLNLYTWKVGLNLYVLKNSRVNFYYGKFKKAFVATRNYNLQYLGARNILLPPPPLKHRSFFSWFYFFPFMKYWCEVILKCRFQPSIRFYVELAFIYFGN